MKAGPLSMITVHTRAPSSSPPITITLPQLKLHIPNLHANLHTSHLSQRIPRPPHPTILAQRPARQTVHRTPAPSRRDKHRRRPTGETPPADVLLEAATILLMVRSERQGPAVGIVRRADAGGNQAVGIRVEGEVGGAGERGGWVENGAGEEDFADGERGGFFGEGVVAA